MVGAYRIMGRLGAGGQGVVYGAASPTGAPWLSRCCVRSPPVMTGSPGRSPRRAGWSRLHRSGAGRVDGRPAVHRQRVHRRALPAAGGPTCGRRPAATGREHRHGAGRHPRGRDRAPGFQARQRAARAGRAAGHRLRHRPRPRRRGPRQLPRTRQHGTGSIVGTPAYMAPEQLAGTQVGSAADVFAWASVIVFAGTGTPPFGEDSCPPSSTGSCTANRSLAIFRRRCGRSCTPAWPRTRATARPCGTCFCDSSAGRNAKRRWLKRR